MDLRRQIAVLRAWLWLLLLAMVLAGGSAFLVSNALPKSYEARAELLVGQQVYSNNPDYNQVLASQRLSQTYAAMATTRPLAQKVIDKLQLSMSPDGLLAKVQANAPTNSSLVDITVTDGDAARAASIANEVSEQLVAKSLELQSASANKVDQQIVETQNEIDAVKKEIAQLQALTSPSVTQQQLLVSDQARQATLLDAMARLVTSNSSADSNFITVLEPAIAPKEASSPRPLLNTAMAVLLGLLAAAGFAFLIEFLDDSVKTPDEVSELVNVPALGALPVIEGDPKRQELYRLVTLLYPKAPASEAYRTLRTNIQFASVDKSLRTLLVTSSVPQEGKTTTAANLAIAFAQAGQSVLLVDCDLRKPGVHGIFGLQNEQGMSTLFRRHDNVQDLLQVTEQPNLWILTAGPVPPNPSELLGSRRMAALLAKFSEIADIVILDSPPLQAVTDAAILASKVDGVLMVVGAGKTRRAIIRHGREALERTGATVIGVALNRMKAGAGGDAYSYYYYHYYSAEGTPDTGSKSARRRRGPKVAAGAATLDEAPPTPAQK